MTLNDYFTVVGIPFVWEGRANVNALCTSSTLKSTSSASRAISAVAELLVHCLVNPPTLSYLCTAYSLAYMRVCVIAFITGLKDVIERALSRRKKQNALHCLLGLFSSARFTSFLAVAVHSTHTSRSENRNVSLALTRDLPHEISERDIALFCYRPTSCARHALGGLAPKWVV